MTRVECAIAMRANPRGAEAGRLHPGGHPEVSAFIEEQLTGGGVLREAESRIDAVGPIGRPLTWRIAGNF
jgi:hypothetical protein